MHGVMIVSVVFGGIILALAIVGSTILMAIKTIKGGLSPSGQKSQADETKMIQEIYDGMSRMEERVEALETILMDRERKGKAL